MIQDMFGPEMFTSSFQVRNLKTGQVSERTALFQDVATCGVSAAWTSDNSHSCSCSQWIFDSPFLMFFIFQPFEEIESSSGQIMERLNFYCVSIPAENDWTRQVRSVKFRAKTLNIWYRNVVQIMVFVVFLKSRSPTQHSIRFKNAAWLLQTFPWRWWRQ